jgi:hypothetical protein
MGGTIQVAADCHCGDAFDIAYDGCLLAASINVTMGWIRAIQPDLTIFDIEGWIHWELWQTNVVRSATGLAFHQRIRLALGGY